MRVLIIILLIIGYVANEANMSDTSQKDFAPWMYASGGVFPIPVSSISMIFLLQKENREKNETR